MTPEEIRQQIIALDFAQTELLLYLDVHPEDSAARMQWEKNAEALETLAHQYAKQTGEPWPLRQNHDGGTLAWVNSPWPWDNQQ